MLTRETYLKGVIKINFDAFRNLVEKVSESVKDIAEEERGMFDEPLLYIQFCNNPESVLKIKLYDREELTEIGSVPVLESETAINGEYRDISISDIENIHKFMDKFIADDGSVCILDGTIYLFFSIRKMIVNVDDECLVIY
jgi:restriction endonuclease S subunit